AVVAHRRIRHDAGVEPGIADVWDARHQVARLRIADLELIDPRPMRTVALEVLPALDGAFLQLLARADHLELARDIIDPDRQGETPETLLRDHPVAHVLEPVQFLLLAVLRNPANLLDDVHDLL